MYCNTCNTIRYSFLYICLVRSVNLRLFHNIQSKMNEISFDLLVVDQSQHSRRKKRQATNTTAPTFDPMASNFSLALVTSGCRTYDESTNQWVDSGCQVTYCYAFRKISIKYLPVSLLSNILLGMPLSGVNNKHKSNSVLTTI